MNTHAPAAPAGRLARRKLTSVTTRQPSGVARPASHERQPAAAPTHTLPRHRPRCGQQCSVGDTAMPCDPMQCRWHARQVQGTMNGILPSRRTTCHLHRATCCPAIDVSRPFRRRSEVPRKTAARCCPCRRTKLRQPPSPLRRSPTAGEQTRRGKRNKTHLNI